MRTIRPNQLGFVHLALIVVLVLLVVVGFAGYRVVQNNNKTTADSSTEKAVPSKIESKNDIQAASKALDSDQQDSAMDPSQLDSDLNDLL
jgi:hypothetical protein